MRYDLEGPAYLLHGVLCFSVFAYAAIAGVLNYYGEQYAHVDNVCANV
jgi:hypothetical protein